MSSRPSSSNAQIFRDRPLSLLCSGNRNTVQGLEAADHNGKDGSVVGYQGERYKVKLVEGETTLALKEANLEEVVDPREEEAPDDEATASTEEPQPREEEEICPLCLEPIPSDVQDFTLSKKVLFGCCGTRFCRDCVNSALGHQMRSCPMCRDAPNANDSDAMHVAQIRKHAANGRPWAAHQLGMIYGNGEFGVRQNDKLAYDWHRKAADKGYIPGCHWVGVAYENGRGVTQSYPRAWEWYGKGVAAGYALSQYRSAMMHIEGYGMKKDVPEGLRLLRLAAEQNYDRALEQLALCYECGVGVEESLRSAITVGLKAAKQKNCFAAAQKNLGMRLVKFHFPHFPPSAMYWLRKAAANGCAESRSFLSNVEKILASVCANCGLQGTFKKRCSRCHAASYCSEKCQKAHWKRGGHKKLCCDKNMDIDDFKLDFVAFPDANVIVRDSLRDD